MLLDEEYKIKAAKIYMVDFLGNTYAHRYEKMNQKTRKEPAVAVSAPMAVKAEEPVMEVENVTQGEQRSAPTQEEKEPFKGKDGMDTAKEAKIREILEEFLA